MQGFGRRCDSVPGLQDKSSSGRGVARGGNGGCKGRVYLSAPPSFGLDSVTGLPNRLIIYHNIMSSNIVTQKEIKLFFGGSTMAPLLCSYVAARSRAARRG